MNANPLAPWWRNPTCTKRGLCLCPRGRKEQTMNADALTVWTCMTCVLWYRSRP